MRYNLFRLFLFSAIICFTLPVSGQINIRGMDSVSLIKPKRNKFIYKYNVEGTKEISCLQKDPVILQHDAKRPFLRDIGNNVLTLVTGIGWGSSTSVYWKVGSVIKCNDALPDWSIELFCEGKQETERDRVRNSDGSFDVETETINTYIWDKNATGLIIEGVDTIGSFLIIMNPREDSLLRPWSGYAFLQRQIEINAILGNKLYMRLLQWNSSDFGLIGTFRDRKFFIISNSSARKIWFFSNNEPGFIFQPDLDEIVMKKKDRVMPYLLINNKIPGSERRDLLRLAVMSRFLSTTLR